MYFPDNLPRTRGNSWFLGLDLGQRQDFTAIATLTCEWTTTGRDPVSWEWIRVPKLILRDVDRFPLGTSYLFYPAAVERRVKHIRDAEAAQNAYAVPTISLAVDASGPGGPIVDEFRRARLGITIRPHLITGGNNPSKTPNGDTTVPRKALLTNLVLLIDKARLVVPPQIQRWQTLLEELLELNAATTHPDRSSAHDDMVLAVALAAWQAVAEIPQLLPERHVSRSSWTPAGSLF